jgi:hypothetical protein
MVHLTTPAMQHASLMRRAAAGYSSIPQSALSDQPPFSRLLVFCGKAADVSGMEGINSLLRLYGHALLWTKHLLPAWWFGVEPLCMAKLTTWL